jgi:hypothetical protein
MVLDFLLALIFDILLPWLDLLEKVVKLLGVFEEAVVFALIVEGAWALVFHGARLNLLQ